MTVTYFFYLSDPSENIELNSDSVELWIFNLEWILLSDLKIEVKNIICVYIGWIFYDT